MPRGEREGEEHVFERVGVVAEQLLERRLGDDGALRDDHDVVGGLGDLGERVAGEQHGPALGGEAAQEVAQPADAIGVEAVGGLVEDEDARDRR